MAFQLATNLDLGAQIPLDVRTVVSNITERNALVPNKVYQGLIVYVTSENKYYYYNTSNTWVELGTAGGQGATGATGSTGATGATGPATLNFTIRNSGGFVARNSKIGADTSSGTFIIDLPTTNLQIGDIVEIIDANETFHINNLTVRSLSHNIEGAIGTEGLVCNVQGAHFILVWVGGTTGWKLSILDNNANAIVDSNKFKTLLFLRIDGTDGLFPSNNSANYKIPWNNIAWYDPSLVALSSVIDNSKIVTYNSSNRNFCITQPGLYSIDMRYASYDLLDSTDFLRIRLRNFSSPYEGGLSQNSSVPDPIFGQGNAGIPGVFTAFAQGPIGTTQNGEGMAAGFTTFRVTQSQVPLYLFSDFLHAGALWTNPNPPFNQEARGFPVFDNFYGTRPFLILSQVSNEI
jgi:hypothetical protein